MTSFNDSTAATSEAKVEAALREAMQQKLHSNKPFECKGAAKVSWTSAGVPYVVLVPFGDEHMRPELLAERRLIAAEECKADPSLNGPAHWLAMGVWDCANVALSGQDEHRIGVYAPIYAAALSAEIEALEGPPAPFVDIQFHPTASAEEGSGTFIWSRAKSKNYKALKREAEKAHPTYFPRGTIGLELVARLS
jgi:hypothetical protein